MDLLMVWFRGVWAWFATGVDDQIVLFALLIGTRGRSAKAVGAGTLVGVLAMLGCCLLARQGLMRGPFLEWTHYLGLVPVLIGLSYLKAAHDGDEAVNADSSPLRLFFGAMLAYLGNAIDDFAVNTSLILQENFQRTLVFCFGVLTGAVVAVLFGRRLAASFQRHTRTLQVVAGATLILIGFLILFRLIGGQISELGVDHVSFPGSLIISLPNAERAATDQ